MEPAALTSAAFARPGSGGTWCVHAKNRCGISTRYAERRRDKAKGGIGLGLTLCKRIVEAHGGTITAENREEGGLAVRVALPMRSE